MKEPKKIDLTEKEIQELSKRLKDRCLDPGDYEIIDGIIKTYVYLYTAVQKKRTSIKRLLQVLFGSTEKSKKLLKKSDKHKVKEAEEYEAEKADPAGGDKSDQAKQKKAKGHGRNGASAYSGAERVAVKHPDLKTGDPCPLCPKGKVYKLKEPEVVIRILGQPPLVACAYEMDKLRCNSCGAILKAELPEEAGQEKYDETAGSMIALLRYGSGFPFKRLESLQDSFGVPLPASTQWEVAEGVADRIYPVFDELIRQAAQGKIIYTDDTPMKILELMQAGNTDEDCKQSSRTGLFTTGIVSIVNDRKIGLFFTGRNHAGENMTELLRKRSSGLDPPIQMCDALSRNLPETFKVILANCLVHGRRNFVDVLESFPEQCQYVIETLSEVYKNDAITKQHNMSPDERLSYHQTHSESLMEDLHQWLKRQIEEKKAEPNSGLGKAINYMLNHWKALTQFLRVPGAPLDNNICERALKKAILHRKNSLFYKTEHGAYIGDLFMSIIHTCNLSKINPFKYLTLLQKHSSKVFKNPHLWLPWNYQTALLSMSSA
jgi:hypothetical protein